jgi:hypothetical protein
MTEKERNEKVSKLKTSYTNLLQKQAEESEQASNKIKELNKQLILLYNLLKHWEQ